MATVDFQNITNEIFQKVQSFEPSYEIADIGIVSEVGEGIARVRGLDNVGSQELVEFETGAVGIAFTLEQGHVGVIILGNYLSIKPGMVVKQLNRIASVPVGVRFLGRVINPLGEPIDGKGSIQSEAFYPIERPAPEINQRANVDTPLQTGIKAIDAMIPIGRGQRELIIGDRQTGKTAIAIDTILNQRDSGVKCIYVAIGQKKSSIAQIIARLTEHNALAHTIIIVAGADDNAAMQYIAPYAGCAMSEYFMDQGEDVLVIYDDLTKHAWAYRQLSLLLRRPPGREAYPGDLFYLHSRLLERSARMAREYVFVPASFTEKAAERSDAVDGAVYRGPMARKEIEAAYEARTDREALKIAPVSRTGGSSTAFPIIETQLGDVSAFVPTNVISITDGQIYLEAGLFNAGIRPAINVGISVSRVGGSAQSPAIRSVAGSLRLDMAAYHEISSFSQYGSDIDPLTKKQLDRGERLQELLKQPQYAPYSLGDEYMVLFAGLNGYLANVPVRRVLDWSRQFLTFMHTSYSSIGYRISATGKVDDVLKNRLVTALSQFEMIYK